MSDNKNGCRTGTLLNSEERYLIRFGCVGDVSNKMHVEMFTSISIRDARLFGGGNPTRKLYTVRISTTVGSTTRIGSFVV